MVVIFHIYGCVVIFEIVRMILMNQLIVIHKIEHIRLVFGNVIMVDVLAQINDVIKLMMAVKKKENLIS
jgi:hypothetical protein